MNLHYFGFNFLKKNKLWSISSLILFILNYPLEIISLSVLISLIFTKINNLEKNFKTICILIAILIVVFLFLESTVYLKDRIDAHYFPKMEREIRLGIYNLVMKKIEINYDNLKSGDLISRLLKTPTFVSFYYERINRYIIPYILTIVTIVIYLTYLNPLIGFASALIFGAYTYIIYLIGKTDIKNSQDRETEEHNMLEEIDDTLNNSLSIITSGNIDNEHIRISGIHNSYDKILEKQSKGSCLVKFSTSILNIVIFLILVSSTLYLFKMGKISTQTTIAIITIFIFLLKHFRILVPRVCEYFVFHGTLEENNNFIKDIIGETEVDGTLKNFPIKGNIEFRNVFFQYPNTSKLTLKGITFKIKENEKVAIVGTSGSGKSSILKLILGFYKPSKGTILIDGRDVTQINRKYLRSNISIVNQNIKLFNRSILSNIAYATKYTPNQIAEKLQKMDIMKVFHNLPKGLDSPVGKYGDRLSGGQKQIVYLLRCYFRENPIIILDEPTASIDDFHKEQVLKLINEISKKSTLIIISHDQSIYNLFPKQIHIYQGEQRFR